MADAAARFRERVLAASSASAPLVLRGGGTKDFLGGVSAGDVLDMRDHSGVVDYDPAELVLTARGGTPLAEIESLLAEKNQMLPFEPPRFGDGATLGGCVAAGLSGPRRAASGAVRDFVLGATVMDGRGQVLRFGGQVMKNVAGYDVARLMAGAYGTLGILLDVSLKVLPRAPREATLRIACDEADALRRFDDWGGRPLPISATAWWEGHLHVRLSGAVASVEKNCIALEGERLEERAAADLWSSLREQTHAHFAQPAAGRTLWRLALPATTPPLGFPEPALLEWGGTQRWILAPDAEGARIRAAARAAGGHAVAFRRADRAAPAFDALPEPVLAIHRRLKDVFDPARIFNRGRLHDDL